MNALSLTALPSFLTSHEYHYFVAEFEFCSKEKTNMKTKKFARIEAKNVRKNVRRPRGRKTTAELDLGYQNKWNMSETRGEWRKRTGRGDFFQNGTGMGLQTRGWWHETPIGSFFFVVVLRIWLTFCPFLYHSPSIPCYFQAISIASTSFKCTFHILRPQSHSHSHSGI